MQMVLAKQFGKGLAYGLLMDVGAAALLWLLASSPMAPWVLVLFWAMGVLAVTGFAIVESRWLQLTGFWLAHGAVFTAWLLGIMALLKAVSQSR